MIGCMEDVFIASEAVRMGALTRGQLRWNYRPVFPDVHLPRDAELRLHERTLGAWLWSGRRGVVTGRAAAALHGALWVDDFVPIELIHANCHPPSGVITRRERIGADEISQIGGIAVTSPNRTALDLGRHLPRRDAVIHLDALAHATGISQRHVLALALRYKGARGVKRCRRALALMNAGAASPKETWLRLLVIEAGFRPPLTQIAVYDETGYVFAYLDMGWTDRKIALEYDGDQHRTDRTQYVKDTRRLRKLEQMGWIVIRVIAEDTPTYTLDRVREAFAQREREIRAVKRAS
jgi:Protein of unknown function (DUF559)